MAPPSRIIGRYALFDELASGGMATVHIARLMGPVGFSRTVAIKRLHPHFAKDPEFTKMFLDEARLAARIRHPNVVATLDVVSLDEELFLVMDYVQGETLSRLMRASAHESSVIDPRVVCTIMTGVLHGLHAAHEAKSERGESLDIVHRDVSPQNVLVGVDGVPRLLDFGVAKATHRVQTTRDGQVKGKIAYMAPEQLRSEHVDRRTDVYAASVVMWEALTCTRLFDSGNDARALTKVLMEPIPTPRSVLPSIPEALEKIVMKGLERDADKRYASARDMAVAIESALPAASATEVGSLVERLAHDILAARAGRVAEIESESTVTAMPLPVVDDDPSFVRRTPSPSSIPAVPRERSRKRVVIGTIAAVAAVTTGLVWLAISKPRTETAPAFSTRASAPPSESAVVSAATASSSAFAPASASAVVHVEASSSPSSAHVVRPSATRTPTTDKCNPPYVVDGAGIRHLKPECM